MAHASKPDARPIRFERVFDGPVEDLWALWTTKEGFEEWFAPAGCRVEVPVLELRVGGAFDHVMTAEAPEPVAYMESVRRPRSALVRGRFVEIVPHERLHIRLTIDFLPDVEPYPYDIVVELHAEGERVRMVVTADAHPDAEITRLAGQTLESQLRTFERLLASRRGKVTFALNVTLDGCHDHREMVADDEMLDYFTRLMDGAGAMLYGRTTYELMEGAWPAVARDEKAPRAMREWARKLEAKPKYVVSASRRDFPWNNTVRIEGDLREAVRQLKEKTPRGVLVGSPTLSAALERLGLIDEYRIVVHPVIAGHGPTLFQGLEPSRRLALVSTERLKSGVMALHYRREAG